MREGLNNQDEFFAELIPHVVSHLFDSSSVDLMRWMDITEEDIEEYREEVLESDEDE